MDKREQILKIIRKNLGEELCYGVEIVIADAIVALFPEPSVEEIKEILSGREFQTWLDESDIEKIALALSKLQKPHPENGVVCECAPVKGVISAFCDICGKPIQYSEQENIKQVIIKIYQRHCKGHTPTDSLLNELIGFFGGKEIKNTKPLPPQEKGIREIEEMGEGNTEAIYTMKHKINEIIDRLNSGEK